MNLFPGSENDIIVVPNLPLFGAMAKMKNENDFAKGIFKTIVNSYDFAKDKKPFLTMTVKRKHIGSKPDKFLISEGRQKLKNKYFSTKHV